MNKDIKLVELGSDQIVLFIAKLIAKNGLDLKIAKKTTYLGLITGLESVKSAKSLQYALSIKNPKNARAKEVLPEDFKNPVFVANNLVYYYTKPLVQVMDAPINLDNLTDSIELEVDVPEDSTETPETTKAGEDSFDEAQHAIDMLYYEKISALLPRYITHLPEDFNTTQLVSISKHLGSLVPRKEEAEKITSVQTFYRLLLKRGLNEKFSATVDKVVRELNTQLEDFKDNTVQTLQKMSRRNTFIEYILLSQTDIDFSGMLKKELTETLINSVYTDILTALAHISDSRFTNPVREALESHAIEHSVNGNYGETFLDLKAEINKQAISAFNIVAEIDGFKNTNAFSDFKKEFEKHMATTHSTLTFGGKILAKQSYLTEGAFIEQLKSLRETILEAYGEAGVPVHVVESSTAKEGLSLESWSAMRVELTTPDYLDKHFGEIIKNIDLAVNTRGITKAQIEVVENRTVNLFVQHLSTLIENKDVEGIQSYYKEIFGKTMGGN